jgi:hypothetical protein
VVEQWIKSFADTVMYARPAVEEGYILVTGTLIYKTNIIGNVEWSYDTGYSTTSVEQASDGGFVVTGTTGDTVYLAKISTEGSREWIKTYGDSIYGIGNSVQRTFDDGYIIAGTTSINNNTDIYIIRTNESGDLIWEKTLGGNGSDFGNYIQCTNDGGYIVVGETDSFNHDGLTHIYLAKIAPDCTPPHDLEELEPYDPDWLSNNKPDEKEVNSWKELDFLRVIRYFAIFTERISNFINSIFGRIR